MIETQLLKGNLIKQEHSLAFTLNQYDKNISYKINLIGVNGNGYTLDSSDVVTIEWQKPNGQPLLQTSNIVKGDTYITLLTPEAISQIAGTGSYNIIITNGDTRKGTIKREYSVISNSMRSGTTSEDVIGDNIIELQALVNTVQTYDSRLEEKANKSDIGSPLIASTVSEMTDTTKVYVYVGSETGYTSGNWYSYDGTSWTSGGVYNSQGISDNSITPKKTTFFGAVSSGKNKYNKDNVTNGYYLDYSSGNKLSNSGFCYCDYEEIKSNTLYILNLSSVQICFYNANKEYISGFLSSATERSFTTPDNAKYYIASVNIDYKDQFMIVEGDTLGTYEPYTYVTKIKEEYIPTPKSIFNKLIIVDINGNGDYSTIQEAVDNSIDGDLLLIAPGIYIENVNCVDKKLYIVGIVRDACILKSTDNRYEYPPLEIAKGYILNMTIYAERLEGATPPDSSEHYGYTPYAVHIDWIASCDSDLTFENCTLKSDWNAGAGIGLRKNFTLTFRNCNLISTDTTNTNGALYFHDANAEGTYGRGDITVENCNIKSSSDIAIMPASSGVVTDDNSVYMHMYRNIIYSETNGKANSCVGVGRPVTGDGWRQYNNFFLTGDSFGNNIDLFNA